MKWKERAKAPIVFLLFFICNGVYAQNQFTFTPLCQEAAKNIRVLKLKAAEELLREEKALRPNNCAVDYLENYIDFYTLITNQDINELRKREKQKSIRLERLSKTAPSPYRLFAQAEINLQWAFSRVFQQEFFSAAMEFRDSYKLLEQNVKLYPAFAPNRKDIGMLKAMLGTIPDNFQWALNIVGMKGDFRTGMIMLQGFLEEELPAEQILEKQSGEYYYTFLQLTFGDKQECWKFCKKVTDDYEDNLLSCYLRAFTGIKSAHNEDAIAALKARPHGQEYASFPILDYLMGVALLNKLNDDAAIYLKKYVTFSKGQNLVKDAYKRLSWLYLVNGETDKFNIYRGMITRYGSAVAEEDKQALKEAENKTIYNPGLLRARLLFDGGYYDKALQQMAQANVTSVTDKTEKEYRYGRIYHEMQQSSKAIEHYENCIALSGPDTRHYFAPVSCTQLGAIYEKAGSRQQAILHYEKALTYKGYDYRNSTAQKAKAGLARLKP